MDNSPPGSSIHGIFQGRILDQSVSSVAQSCPTLWDPVDCRLPCPLPSPRICSKSCPLSQCCHPTVSSSSVIPFSSCPQSFLGSVSFPMCWLFIADGQIIRALGSASVLSVNIHGWFPLGLTSLISLQSKGLSRVFPSTTVQKHQFFIAWPSLWSNSQISIHEYWKNHSFYCAGLCHQSDVSAF